MKKKILNLLRQLKRKNNYLSSFISWAQNQYMYIAPVTINNEGRGRLIHKVLGKGNVIKIGKGTKLTKTVFYIIGDNCCIELGRNCQVAEKCSFWCVGNNTMIKIGDNTSFNHHCHFMNGEDGSTITIGKDCMFSLDITLRTSDSHPIFDKETMQRINPPQSIIVDDHVWIASHVDILKGVTIGEGSVVGANTVVTKDVPPYTLTVGMPNRIVKENVCWKHQL